VIAPNAPELLQAANAVLDAHRHPTMDGKRMIAAFERLERATEAANREYRMAQARAEGRL